MANTATKTTVTAYLCANGAAEAIEFYKRAFGAEERYRMADLEGRIGHAEITVGGSTLFVSDEWAAMRVLSPNTLNATLSRSSSMCRTRTPHSSARQMPARRWSAR